VAGVVPWGAAGVPRGATKRFVPTQPVGVSNQLQSEPNQSGFPISCNQNPTSQGFQSVAIRTQPVKVSNHKETPPPD